MPVDGEDVNVSDVDDDVVSVCVASVADVVDDDGVDSTAINRRHYI